MVYDTQTIVSTPKYRRWTGSWGSEASANDVNGVIKHQVLKFSLTRDEAILATLTSTGELQAQVWNGSSWGVGTSAGDARTVQLERIFFDSSRQTDDLIIKFWKPVFGGK